MQKKAAQLLLRDPMLAVSNLPASDSADFAWYVRLTSQLFYMKGYFVDEKSWLDLNFPSYNMFTLHPNGDVDISKLYKNFAWRGWLKYFQPIIESGELKTFAYQGTTPLSNACMINMLRYPPVDWINATLLNGLKMSAELHDFIESNRIDNSRGVYRQFKAEAARLYALLYLLDNTLFVARTYSANFENQIAGFTRSPELLRSLVPEQAEQLISVLSRGEGFSAPVTGIVPCVKLTATTISSVMIQYTAEYAELDTRDDYLQLLPFFQMQAYTDGFSQRLNDMPNKAAMLTLELQKTGESQRYATLSSSVFRSVYASTDMIKVNNRARFSCGLDIIDYSFKYWNLQSSINTDRHFSGFSPFSLRAIQNFDIAKLSRDVLNTHYDNIRQVFQSVIANSNEHKLKLLAQVCGINPNRPSLRIVLEDFEASKHPTDLYKIISNNVALFK